MVTFQITTHGGQRLRQRGITVEDLEAAMTRCHKHKPGHGTNWMHYSRARGRVIKIVTVQRSCTGRLTLVTAMWKDE